MSDIPVTEQVIAAFAALFAGLEDENGTAVAVSVNVDAAGTEFPGLIVELGAVRPQMVSWPRMDATIDVTVYGSVQVAAVEGREDEAQAALRAAVNQMDGLVLRRFFEDEANIHLGGIADNVRYLSTTRDVAENASVPTAGFSQAWEIDTFWAVNDPFSQTIGG